MSSVKYSFNSLQDVFKKLYKYTGHWVTLWSHRYVQEGKVHFQMSLYNTKQRLEQCHRKLNPVKNACLHHRNRFGGGGCSNSIALLPKWLVLIRYAIWQPRCSCLLISRFDLPVGIRTVNCIWLFGILVEFYSPLLSWYIPIHWFCMWLQMYIVCFVSIF